MCICYYITLYGYINKRVAGEYIIKLLINESIIKLIFMIRVNFNFLIVDIISQCLIFELI